MNFAAVCICFSHRPLLLLLLLLLTCCFAHAGLTLAELAFLAMP